MTQSATTNRLHSLLFEEGRQLVNFKFFPGDDRGLSASEMCEAAEAAIRSALAKGLVDNAPATGKQKQMI
ncbi:hypothetical protein TRP8649_03531 [Pelagimonas phthalicica]|uniref:Uncharacterized protein n=1 Tax=Pelagimonas phthalicica TaxID=1037362 RepID=A0A238JGY6_9RHOB|nr:hypothetical protein [Pelagimonas phthalicica]TDS92336.1 hypothetical protein CLV87_3528 [Pelagimonas phthalicica]SMX29397.1 hypothetical protein TRP8649_03531 [Pelagimonas phthalicica]